MFIVYVWIMFGNKYVQFRIICPLLGSIIVDTFYVDPHSNQYKNSPWNQPIGRPINVLDNWVRFEQDSSLVYICLMKWLSNPDTEPIKLQWIRQYNFHFVQIIEIMYS